MRHAAGLEGPPAAAGTTPGRQGALHLGEPTPEKTAAADLGAVAPASLARKKVGQRLGRVVVVAGARPPMHVPLGSPLMAIRRPGAASVCAKLKAAFFGGEALGQRDISIILESGTHTGLQVEVSRVLGAA